MRWSGDFKGALTVLAVFIFTFLAGCSDPRADQRAQLCKGAGLSADVVQECRRSQEDYNRIMEPIRARQAHKEAEVFNAAVNALPSSTVQESKYQRISIEELNNRHQCCFLTFTDARGATEHPLFGKRYSVFGKIRYHEKDSEGKPNDSISIEASDNRDRLNTWHLDADIESLDREERTLIRSHCVFLYTFDDCTDEFFGVIGRIERGAVEVLGLQVEHMRLMPRRPNKPS